MTPRQKKRLSYARDRRNSFGENGKASRKSIPLRKAQDIRAERHAQDGSLARALRATDADALAEVENRVRATEPRQWRKWPDEPLGEMLARRAAQKRR